MTSEELRYEYSPGHDFCAGCWIPERELRYRRHNSQLELAHIIPRSRGGNNGQCVANVLMLCSSCHGAVHNSRYIPPENSKPWPELSEAHLIVFKDELVELDIPTIAHIAGWTWNHVESLMFMPIPEEIVEERYRWKPSYFYKKAGDHGTRKESGHAI